MKNRRIRQPFGLWMRLFRFLYNLLLVVLAVLFLVNRVTGQVHAKLF